MASRITVGITGISRAVCARRVMELAARAGVETHLTVSARCRQLVEELGLAASKPTPRPACLFRQLGGPGLELVPT